MPAIHSRTFEPWASANAPRNPLVRGAFLGASGRECGTVRDGEGAQGWLGQAHLPTYTGGRFSAKARKPSAKSRMAKLRWAHAKACDNNSPRSTRPARRISPFAAD